MVNTVPLVFLTLFFSVYFVSSIIHTVSEGHVGVYWRGGRLLSRIAEPGWHVKLPVIDAYDEVQVTMQTDSVKEIPCGTAGGVLVYFDRIEVVNRLRKDNVYETIKEYGVNYDKIWIFDKIHHEINQFCSKHTLREVVIDLFDTLDESLMKALQTDCDRFNTGIDIISVRVTKPRIPESMRRGYERIEEEKAALYLASEHQKVVEKEAQTAANKAKIQAEMAKSVRAIELQKEILEKEGVRRIKEIEAEIHLAQERALADAALYAAEQEVKANKLRLTPEYLQLQTLLAIARAEKIYFGESIPHMLSTNMDGLSKLFHSLHSGNNTTEGIVSGNTRRGAGDTSRRSDSCSMGNGNSACARDTKYG